MYICSPDVDAVGVVVAVGVVGVVVVVGVVDVVGTVVAAVVVAGVVAAVGVVVVVGAAAVVGDVVVVVGVVDEVNLFVFILNTFSRAGTANECPGSIMATITARHTNLILFFILYSSPMFVDADELCGPSAF